MTCRISNDERHPQRTHRAVWCIIAFVLLLSGHSSHRSAVVDILPTLHQAGVIAPGSRPVPAFRLGTAGRPLGWTTAIGDLNVDGTPDLAIADRVAQRTNGYDFRIELSVSGQPTDAFTFESSNDAVTISLSDVDADDDLDLVVRASLSNEPVGVWLNDGHGRFTSSTLRQLPGALSAREALGAAAPGDDFAVVEVPPNSAGACASAVLAAGAEPLPCRGFDPRHHFDLPATLRASTAGPRAPPLNPAVS